jgi:hypothetical protein
MCHYAQLEKQMCMNSLYFFSIWAYALLNCFTTYKTDSINVLLQLFTKCFLSSDYKLAKLTLKESVRKEVGNQQIAGETSWFCYCPGKGCINKN